MKFEWRQLDTSIHNDRPIWGLYLVHRERYSCMFGTMTKLRNAWRIMEVNKGGKPDYYWLDSSLSLDEAQRAAKLFLCVGRPT